MVSDLVATRRFWSPRLRKLVVVTALRSLLPWLLFAVALLATAGLLVVRGDDLAALRSLGAPSVVALVALQGVYLVVQSGRFHVVLVRFAERAIGFGPWFALFVLGRFLNLFVPQAGNVYRAVELQRRHGISVQRFVVAFVNAPWLAMILNFLLGAVAVGLFAPGTELAGWPLWAVLLGAACATVLAPLAVLALLQPLLQVPQLQRYPLLGRVQARAAEMVAVTLASLRDPRYLLRVGAWTLVSFVQASYLMVFGFAALGLEVGVGAAVTFYVLLQVTTYVQLTPGNLGVQELAFGVLSTGFGASAADGVLVSALLRVTGVVALVAMALPLGGLEALRASRVGR
jgi:uncharacterized membrane protein YbhN (UPF0104 family)